MKDVLKYATMDIEDDQQIQVPVLVEISISSDETSSESDMPKGKADPKGFKLPFTLMKLPKFLSGPPVINFHIQRVRD